jgi:hypothetical protein
MTGFSFRDVSGAINDAADAPAEAGNMPEQHAVTGSKDLMEKVKQTVSLSRPRQTSNMRQRHRCVMMLTRPEIGLVSRAARFFICCACKMTH